MSDLLGLDGVTAPAGAPDQPPAATAAAANKPAAPVAAGGGAGAISRADLILLVQKLQKRAAASDAQVVALKKQVAEASPPPRATTSSDNLVDLAPNGTLASAGSNESALSPQQSATHAAQLANLQAELRSRSEAIESLTRQASDSRKDVDSWKKRCQAASDEVTRLQLTAATPSPGAVISPSNAGGSFLLENANKALRAELVAEQAKTAAAEQRAAQLERAQADASKSSSGALDGTQKRLVECEAKLANADSKLMKSFQLIQEEKKRGQAADEELKALGVKMASMAAALQTSQELLREHQGQSEQAQSELASLRATNFKLASRVDQSSSDDATELKKNLVSRDEQLAALQNELDHTRSIHARTIANLENESAMQTRQLEDALEEERRNSERVTRDGQEALARIEIDRNTARRLLVDTEERAAVLTQEHAAAVSAHAILTTDLAAAQRELAALRSEHESSLSQSSSAFEALQSSSSEKYKRLLHELKQYKIHMITNATALQNELAAAREAVATLEDEIKHGKPAERRMNELAQLQSSRDEALREAERDGASQRAANIDLRGKLEASKAEAAFLQQEVRTARASSSRAHVNLDYLKSVMVQFLAAEHSPAKRQSLVPVIAQLLCFTREELAAATAPPEDALTAAGGFWSALSGMASGKPTPPKRITLPPNVPMGVVTEDHPSPFAPLQPSQSPPLQPHLASASPPVASSTTRHAPSSSLTDVDINGAVPVRQ